MTQETGSCDSRHAKWLSRPQKLLDSPQLGPFLNSKHACGCGDSRSHLVSGPSLPRHSTRWWARGGQVRPSPRTDALVQPAPRHPVTWLRGPDQDRWLNVHRWTVLFPFFLSMAPKSAIIALIRNENSDGDTAWGGREPLWLASRTPPLLRSLSGSRPCSLPGERGCGPLAPAPPSPPVTRVHGRRSLSAPAGHLSLVAQSPPAPNRLREAGHLGSGRGNKILELPLKSSATLTVLPAPLLSALFSSGKRTCCWRF